MTRLDKYLVDKGFFSSRNQAQEAILRGEVMVNGQIAKKFSYKVKPDDKVEVFSEGYPR
jgi:23S rRNA (cytidine1920-2'-O)/16S rRNA (cytidine1409-2'-O)-methyltransferase